MQEFLDMFMFVVSIVMIVTFFYIAYILTKIHDTLGSISHLINFNFTAITKDVQQVQATLKNIAGNARGATAPQQPPSMPKL